MPIMIPVNVQDVPAIPVFNMDEYVSLVSKYATELWNNMVRDENAKFSRRSNMSDKDLEEALANRPSYGSVSHDDMSQLTKNDYSRFARQHNAMKGIAKWM